MAFDIRVQNVLEKKPGMTDRSVATGVTEFCMASGGLNKFKILKMVSVLVLPTSDPIPYSTRKSTFFNVEYRLI